MFSRKPFDDAAYVERIQTQPCFICEILAGRLPHHLVYQDDVAIVFLNKYPLLVGYTLVAPVEHREAVTGDFTLDEYLALQRVIYHTAEAVRQMVPNERVYVLSLGSQQGNAHVHWHIAPLPPGVPFEQQQLAALSGQAGILDIPDDAMAALAAQLRETIERLMAKERTDHGED